MTDEEQVTSTSFTALREENGRTFIIPLIDEEIKVKGVGRLNPKKAIGEGQHGDEVIIGQIAPFAMFGWPPHEDALSLAPPLLIADLSATK